MAKITSYLGLDISLRSSGYYHRTKSGATYGVINTERAGVLKSKDIDRMWVIAIRIAEFLAPGTLVAIEGLAFSRSGRATKDLAGINWLIKFLAYHNRVPYFVVEPSTLKAYVGAKGGGKEGKQDVARRVKELWGEEFAVDDITDAFVLMKMAEHVGTNGRGVVPFVEHKLNPGAVRTMIRERQVQRSLRKSQEKSWFIADGGLMTIGKSTISIPSGRTLQAQGSSSRRKGTH